MQNHDFNDAETTSGAAAKPVVMVVDDEAHEHTFVRNALEALGLDVKVESVFSGEEALEKLLPSEGRPPACMPKVVLLDLRLPGQDGANVLRVLRATPATATLPVIVFTGTEDARVLGEAFRSGADAVLSKTLDIEEHREQLAANIVRYLVEHHEAGKRVEAGAHAAEHDDEGNASSR